MSGDLDHASGERVDLEQGDLRRRATQRDDERRAVRRELQRVGLGADDRLPLRERRTVGAEVEFLDLVLTANRDIAASGRPQSRGSRSGRPRPSRAQQRSGRHVDVADIADLCPVLSRVRRVQVLPSAVTYTACVRASGNGLESRWVSTSSVPVSITATVFWPNSAT